MFKRGDRSRKLTVVVSESTDKLVVDTVQLPTGVQVKRAFPLQGLVGVVRDDWVDMAPYLLADPALNTAAIARQWPRLTEVPRNPMSDQLLFAIRSARHVGTEEITVPAGRFEAIRLEFFGTYDDTNNAAMALRSPPGPLTVNVWYAAQAKRLIKMTAQNRRRTYEMTVELESYRLQ